MGGRRTLNWRVSAESTLSSSLVPTCQVLVGSEATRKLAEDVTIGDKTYKQVQWINSADVSCALIGKTPKGVIQIKLTEKLTLDNPDVKAIIEGIEYK